MSEHTMIIAAAVMLAGSIAIEIISIADRIRHKRRMRRIYGRRP